VRATRPLVELSPQDIFNPPSPKVSLFRPNFATQPSLYPFPCRNIMVDAAFFFLPSPPLFLYPLFSYLFWSSLLLRFPAFGRPHFLQRTQGCPLLSSPPLSLPSGEFSTSPFSRNWSYPPRGITDPCLSKDFSLSFPSFFFFLQVFPGDTFCAATPLYHVRKRGVPPAGIPSAPQYLLSLRPSIRLTPPNGLSPTPEGSPKTMACHGTPSSSFCSFPDVSSPFPRPYLQSLRLVLFPLQRGLLVNVSPVPFFS